MFSRFFKKIPLPYFFGFFVVMSITIYVTWNYSTSEALENGILSVSFLDVGQGDAIYIRAPNGNDVMIDGGPDRSVIQELHQVIPPFDHDIDLIIATHPDKDHIAGLIPIFKDFDVNNYLRSEIHSGTSFDESLIDHEKNEPDLKTILARRGQRIILDDVHGVFLDILFPDQNTEHFKDTNDASIVLQLVYGESQFLLNGDAPRSVEDFLVAHDHDRLQSDVLKLGHHGSKTSSGETFLKQVRPSYAVVSAGKNNRYHHPNPEVVERVTDLGVPILSTIDLGTVTFQTDGKTLWRK